jgi:thymidylate synthase
MIPAPNVIQGQSIGETHDQIICALIKHGCMNEMNTEDNEYTWEYPSPLVAHVIDPIRPPYVSEASDVGPLFLAAYRHQFLTLTPPKDDGKDFSYTYANRWFDYFRRGTKGWLGNGRGGGIDQIQESVINRLKKSPLSRRAVVISWHPEVDILMHEPPCVDLLQFFYRDNVIRLVAYIRSNDMLSAWPQNAYGLTGLLCYVAEALKGEALEGPCTGPVTTISGSAHCYPSRDAKELTQFRAHLRKVGMLCE